MKKILLSTALAVVLVAAFAVTAMAAGVSVSGPSSVSAGETVTITVTGTDKATSGIVSTSGLTINNVSGGLSSGNDFLVVADAEGTSSTYNCTVTAGAGEEVSFSVGNVVVSNGSTDSSASGGSWTATVPAAESEPPEESPSTTPPEPSESTAPSTPSTPPTASESAAPATPSESAPTASVSANPSASASAAASGSVKPGVAGQSSKKPTSGTTNKTDKMPKTGDTTMDLWMLLVIAGACAAVAVVAGKKVFGTK